jgi:hypothetical protein
LATVVDISTADKAEWTGLLERLTRDHSGDLVTIELLDPTYGDLEEAEHLPFIYATYDPRDDVVVVAAGKEDSVALRHMIERPAEVSVSERAARVIDADGAATVVSFAAQSASPGSDEAIT